MSVFSATLDGVTNFNDIDGNTFSWGSNSWIGLLSTYESTAGTVLTAGFDLTGSDWTIEFFMVNDADRNNVTVIQDLDGGSGRQITNLQLGYNSDVDLISSRVQHIYGWDGDLHDVVLGSEWTRSVSLGATVNNVTTGSGHVRLIETGGRDTVVVNSGGAGLVDTGNRRDVITVRDGGYVQSILPGDGNDVLRVNGSQVRSVELGNGNDRVILSNGGRINSLEGNDDNTVVLKDDSRINSLAMDSGNMMIDVQDTSRIYLLKLTDGTGTITTADGNIETIYGYQSTIDATIGAGGVQQMTLGGVSAGRHRIDAEGWIGVLQIWQVGANVTTRGDGAGAIRLGEFRDVVTTKSGYVDLISTNDGNDTVKIGSGGAGTVRTGAGEDLVKTGVSWVELISTGDGDDTVMLGTQGAGQVRLGSGDDSIYLKEMPDPIYGAAISGGSGTDTLDFSAFSTGITFGLDARFYSVGAPGGDIETPATGYFLATSSENLTATNQSDSISGNSGANVLRGLAGNDKISGGGGSDRLIGGNGADVIRGGGGADTLSGGRGNDTMAGNGGADTFAFSANAGTDIVTDFQDGTDLLRISGHSGGFAALVFDDVGGNLEITHDGGTIVLQGLAGTALGADDFDFV